MDYTVSLSTLMWAFMVDDCIQDDGAGLQGSQQNCNHLPPNICQTVHPTSLYYICWRAGYAIAESKERSLREVATLLCSGASLVERTPTQDFISTLHSIIKCPSDSCHFSQQNQHPLGRNENAAFCTSVWS